MSGILQAYLILLRFTGAAFFFLQTEGKTLHHQKDYDSLCCDAYFVTVVWNQNGSISKTCLCMFVRKRDWGEEIDTKAIKPEKKTKAIL